MAATRSQTGWDSLVVRLAFTGEGWSDPGEQAAVEALAGRQQGARILDVGVGAGRTTTILAPGASSYVGVDLSAKMIKMARSRHPGVDLRVGDARDLSGFSDASADLVVFSHNGFDCLPHAARPSFFAEAFRILDNDGALLISSHNLNGPSYGERPGLDDVRARWAKPGLPGKAVTALLGPVRLGVATANYRRTQAKATSGDGWARAPLRSHEFRFVVEFVTFPRLIGEAVAAGFEVEGAWTNRGEAVSRDAERHSGDYTQLLLHKP